MINVLCIVYFFDVEFLLLLMGEICKVLIVLVWFSGVLLIFFDEFFEGLDVKVK